MTLAEARAAAKARILEALTQSDRSRTLSEVVEAVPLVDPRPEVADVLASTPDGGDLGGAGGPSVAGPGPGGGGPGSAPGPAAGRGGDGAGDAAHGVGRPRPDDDPRALTLHQCRKCGATVGPAVMENGVHVALDVEPIVVVHASNLSNAEAAVFREYPYEPLLHRKSRTVPGRVELFGGRLVPDGVLPHAPRVRGWRSHGLTCPAETKR